MPRRTGRIRGAGGGTRKAPIGAGVVLVMALAGCANSMLATPAPADGVGPSPALTAVPVPAVTAPPSIPAGEPPVASLAGLEAPADPVAGTLGAWSWNDRGDSSPWIVPPDAVVAVAGAPLEVVLDRDLTAASWIARWAKVVGDEPGGPEVTAEGAGTISFEAPAVPGAWGLQLEARFGEGRSAAWYWRADVRP